MWANTYSAVDFFTFTKDILNPVAPNASFFYPLKTSENRRFSDVFIGWRKGAFGTNGLMKEFIFCEIT